MKKHNTLLKCVAAAAAVAGIAYLVVRYFDEIHAWLRKLCPYCTLEDDFVVEDHFTPDSFQTPEEDIVADQAVEEDVVADQTVEEAAVAEAPAEDPKAPVADEADFEQA